MAFVSSPAPAHPSSPQGCTCSTLTGLPAQQHPFMDCSHTNSPLWGMIGGTPQPPINLPHSATSRPWMGTEGQLGIQSRTLLAIFLCPPVTNPAAWYQQRSGRQHAGSIWRCRQDHSE